ncbi:MAG: putative beta-lysine N-acetyltransferase [Clostridia bacterium]|nr:putative beta-lysine N-acetyltransferase [Clostridia bacterium]
MNTVQFDVNKSMTIKGVNLYIDYTNSRLKILDYSNISEKIIKEIGDFAAAENLGKIILNCRINDIRLFREYGFVIEGSIPGFFKGEDGYCISCFVNSNRGISRNKQAEDEILYKCVASESSFVPGTDRDVVIRGAVENDIPKMIALFSKVFKTYPSPVFNSEYIKSIMNRNIIFKVAEQEGKIISIASADMDIVHLNAEMTDCATYPEYRGRGLLSNLIYHLEADLKIKGFYTLYSLCRAIEPGINKALCKLDYKYTGTLVNNCDICGGFEDMNIWVKRLK